jgi:signal transduction histidine kinase
MVPTIKSKFLIGFFIIFLVSFLLMNHFVTRIIESSNEKIITQDLIGMKNNGNVYVRQSFMINHFTHDEIYFGQIAQEMVDDLFRSTSSDISAYSTKGELLYASNKDKFAGIAVDEDLKVALNGKTAYTIKHSNNLTEVYYSYPVVIEGKKVGILRFNKDFSYLYEHSRQILNFIFYITIGIFTAAFLFSYILSRNITIPILKLTKASTEVTNGNLDVQITSRRKDEIGKLARNFKQMIEKIKIQIERIENDRDRLKQLNDHRKQFFDNVTHELKTPLTSILGYAQMIKEHKMDDKHFFDKGMNHIVDESERLHGMVISLLELSKETTSEERLEMTEIGQIIQDVSEGMGFKAQRYKKSLQCEIQDNLFVWGRADKLRQLFINVIDNAIKYGYTRTNINVVASLYADQIHIVISNKGELISPEHLGNLFEPFYRADRKKLNEAGSNGLGLSICKAIVDEHQGTIEMTSVNEETNVIIRLPYVKSERDL